MAVNLSKGERVSLSKDNPGLNKVTVGLGWDNRVTDLRVLGALSFTPATI